MRESKKIVLTDFADSYLQKANLQGEFIVQFEFQEEGESWYIVFQEDESPQIRSGLNPNARFTFILSEETLGKLYRGEISPMTAAGRAHISETAPLDFRLGEGLSLTTEIYLELIEFNQQFFNPTSPSLIKLGIDHSRVVHGGHAVAMFYAKGFRSAWYQLEKGDQLNEPGDTNPFPQAFIFLSGAGRARIGVDEIDIKLNEAYLIPPGTEHIVWNEHDEPLTLIFLAWGEGA